MTLSWTVAIFYWDKMRDHGLSIVMVGLAFWRIPMAVWTVHTSTRTAWIQLMLHGCIHWSFTVSLRFTWVQTLTGLGGIGRYVECSWDIQKTDLLMSFHVAEHYYSVLFSVPQYCQEERLHRLFRYRMTYLLEAPGKPTQMGSSLLSLTLKIVRVLG